MTEETTPEKRRFPWGWLVLIALLVFALTQISLFAIQPIGALPEGVTFVMARGQGMKLFDSPDAMCVRIQDGVSLLCRGMVLSQVVEQGTILFRLPYLDFVYSASTGGARYDR